MLEKDEKTEKKQKFETTIKEFVKQMTKFALPSGSGMKNPP